MTSAIKISLNNLKLTQSINKINKLQALKFDAAQNLSLCTSRD
jgi:hypothetical protein